MREQPQSRSGRTPYCVVLQEREPSLTPGPDRPVDDRTMRRALEQAIHGPDRYLRLLELHASAVERRTPSDSQFVALWNALEGFLPTRRGRSRVGQIVSTMEPVMCRTYIRKLIVDLRDDLTRCIGVDGLERLLESLPGSGDLTTRISALVCLESSAPLRGQLYKSLQDNPLNPLLRNRIWYISEKLKNAREVTRTIRSHWQRVSWHILRMFRARNTLVHTAQTPPYLISLVNSLHAYIDLLMDTIAELRTRHPGLQSAEQILYQASLEYRAYTRLPPSKILRRLRRGLSPFHSNLVPQSLETRYCA